jgi:hypothetical protein
MEQFISFSEANSQSSVIIIAVTTIALLALVLFFTFKVDWAKIIGKWFPWALDSDSDRKNKQKD